MNIPGSELKNTLAQLREMTTVVADTGDVDAVKRYAPVDCTTNPSLILKTAQDPASQHIIQAEIKAGRAKGLSAAEICATLNSLQHRLVVFMPQKILDPTIGPKESS